MSKSKEELAKLAWEQLQYMRFNTSRELSEHLFLAGYSAAEPKWISVSERLPPQDEWVLVLRSAPNDESRPIRDAQFLYQDEYGTHWMGAESYEKVTHWTYLPAAPKEDEK